MNMSASDFVKGYCGRSGITEREFYETQVPMPDPASPWGWTAVSNDPLLIKAHVDLYLSQQSEVSSGNSKVIGTYTGANGRDYPIIALGLMKSEKKAQIFIGDEGLVTFLGAHIEPAPVVQCPYPCGWDNLNKLAIQDAAFVAIALVEGEPAKESIRQAAITNNDRLLKVISACRAAMLAAAPQSPSSEPATVPGKWIPVSERIPDNTEPVLCIEKRADFGTYGQPFVCWHDGDGWVGKTNYRPIVTHWMPLPAGPQEVR